MKINQNIQNGFDLERERSSCQLSLEKLRVWEILTASLEEKGSYQNREFKNFASLESRICEDLVYLPIEAVGPNLLKVHFVIFGKTLSSGLISVWKLSSSDRKLIASNP